MDEAIGARAARAGGGPARAAGTPAGAAGGQPPAPAAPGVLLVNLGSPDAPTTAAVRRYLDEFLGDPLVVDLNPLLWWLIRKGIVLPFRGPKSAALYRTVWTPEGSPLLVHARGLARELQAALGAEHRVAVAMRYGNPSIRAGLEELVAQGYRSVVVVPLFPQYSRTTTGSVELAIERAAAVFDPPLDCRLLGPYYGDAGYVAAVAERVRGSGVDEVDHVVLSFHGLPERYVEAGDPYREHCETTARALAAELGLEEGRWSLAFQSRFGRERWLEPDVARLVPALAPGCARVLVACPGFAADCLETLEEIHVRLKKSFLEAGGRELRVAPCLNDDPRWAGALARMVRAALGSDAAPAAGQANAARPT